MPVNIDFITILLYSSFMANDQPDLFSHESDIHSESVKYSESDADFIKTEEAKKFDKLYELSNDAYYAVANARMDDSLNKTCLPKYIDKILCAAGTAESVIPDHRRSSAGAQLAVRNAADKAASDRGDPLVRTVLESAQRVGREIHRLMGLLRFTPVKDGIWLAKCAPDNSILPVFGDYFTRRFNDVPWAIIDEKRGLALVRFVNEDQCLGPLSAFPVLSDTKVTDDHWEDLWRSYHRSVFIENRKNPKLQIQCMPRRYWKYLPELGDRSAGES